MSATDPLNVRRLMVVEDDASHLELLDEVIRSRGYETVLFPTARAALASLEAADQPRPTAILSDIKMPGMSGIEFLAVLRSRGDQLPFVIVTGHESREQLLTAVRLGATDFLEKPWQMADLTAVIDRVLEIGVRQQTYQDLLRRLAERHQDSAADFLRLGSLAQVATRLHALNARGR